MTVGGTHPLWGIVDAEQPIMSRAQCGLPTRPRLPGASAHPFPTLLTPISHVLARAIKTGKGSRGSTAGAETRISDAAEVLPAPRDGGTTSKEDPSRPAGRR